MAQAEPAEAPSGTHPGGVWRSLVDRLDVGAYVPIPTEAVVARRVEGRSGESTWVLRSPARRYLRLDDVDFDLWQRIDGRRSVRQVALDHFVERGGFVAERLARLVRRLRADGFLGPIPADLDALVSESLAARTFVGRASRLANRLLAIDLVRAPWADAALGGAYRRGGWLLYAHPAKLLWALVVLAGLIVWGAQVVMPQHELFQTHGSYTLGLITLAALDVVGVALYQLAQGLALKRYGCQVTAAGLQLYFFLPVIYVETSDVWMSGRRGRMSVSLSGPFASLVLGAALALVAYPLDGTEMGAFLFKAAFVWLANGIFNLLPILDLDGYFLLVDYLEMPALRANALTFVRESLIPRLREGLWLSREERVLTAYGLGYGLLVALIPLAVLEARDLRYASNLGELWASPEPHGRLLALGSAVMLLGPAVLALLSRLAKTLVATVRVAVRWWSRHVRGDVPREYIEALADLPFLRGVPRTDLRTIALHLDEEGVEDGQVIIRQGEVGDRFFVVREGAVRVVRVGASGESETLATLGPGDYFGETALVANVPRTATVVAESPGRLLTLDAGHFRRWMTLRGDVDLMIRRTAADREVLERLPLFRSLGTAELDRIAERMLVTRYSPDDRIVEQGTAGDRFYVLTDGRVEVVVNDSGRETRLAELGVGDFFGEMALLYRRPRTATVRALSPVETYTLSTEDFGALLESPYLDREVRRTARARADRLARLTQR